MTKPDDVPEWAINEAARTLSRCGPHGKHSIREGVARALVAAREEGRREGIEEAATTPLPEGADANPYGDGDPDTQAWAYMRAWNNALGTLRVAIRSLLSPQPAQEPK